MTDQLQRGSAGNDNLNLHLVEDASVLSSDRLEDYKSSPFTPPRTPVVVPSSDSPLWRCCARISNLKLNDDDEDDHRHTANTRVGLKKSDLSFLHDYNPHTTSAESIDGVVLNDVPFGGSSMKKRRVSEDFTAATASNVTTSSETTSSETTNLSFLSSSDNQDIAPQQPQQQGASCTSGNGTNTASHGGWESGWEKFIVRDIPVIYFMEPTTSVVLNVTQHSPETVTKRISECLRCTSVQARYFSDPAAAALLTLEHVEMYLVLWLKKPNQLVVEIQRRRGDSSIFLSYARLILCAAKGEFNASLQEERVRTANQSSNWQESLKSAQLALKHACPTIPFALDHRKYNSTTSPLPSNTEDASSRSVAVIALVSSLISKDDSDARHLGMETACILTDPRRTGISTAVMMSRVVVLGILPGEAGEALGDVCQNIHLTLLLLITTRSFPGSSNSSSINNTYPSSMLSYALEMDDDNECYFIDDEHANEHSKFTSVMFHQALQVLANSLEVLANFETFDPAEGISPEQFLQDLVEAFVHHVNRLAPNGSCGGDGGGSSLVRTLLEECQSAEQQPHNAYLATKILKYLCGASHAVVEEVLHDDGLADLTHAHNVGQKTHLCLELETSQLLALLKKQTRGG